MAWYDNDLVGAFGAVTPVLGGYISGMKASDAQLAAARRAQAAQEAGYTDISAMQSPYQAAGLAALGDIQGFQTVQAPEDFQWTRGVAEYLDPSMQYQQQQMARQVAASAAARGGLLSGAAAKELQTRGSQLAQTDYGNAYNRMANDRNFAYGAYTNKFQQARQANSDNLARLQTLLNSGQNANDTMTLARQGLANDRSGTASQMGQMRANREMLWSQQQDKLMQMGMQAAGMAYGGGFGGGGGGGASQSPSFSMSQPIGQMQDTRNYLAANPTSAAQFGTGGNLGGQGFTYNQQTGGQMLNNAIYNPFSGVSNGY
jgi:hypothetical protein